MISEQTLTALLITSKDGDWGIESPKEGFVPYRVIRGADFPDVRQGAITTTPIRYLNKNTVNRRTLQPKDILIETAGGNRDRPTGRTLFITENILHKYDYPVTCASFSRFLRINPLMADPQYVFWYLQYLYFIGTMWEHQVQHTGVARFQYTKFAESIKIPLPSLPEQREIAGILGALDDKIELNRRMNRTLESMARVVFREWFVENRESKGWEIQTLDQHIESEKGLSYKGEGLSKDSGTPMHNLNSVYEGGGYKYEGIKYYTGEYRERHILHAGDIIVTNTEQGFEYLLIGYPAIVPKRFGETGIFSHHIFRVRVLPTSPVKIHYLYFLLMSPDVREQIIGCTNGTTVNMLSTDGLRIPKFRLPPEALIDRFEQFSSSIFEKMELLYEESCTLASLRDALLPKLMRGEVRVRGNIIQ